MFVSGESQEVEIRGCTIHAVEVSTMIVNAPLKWFFNEHFQFAIWLRLFLLCVLKALLRTNSVLCWRHVYKV